MNTNLQGNLGEIKAMSYFISNGYTVYIPFGTASKNDMIVEKDNKVKRVSVKSTNVLTKSGKYKVKIRQGKLNKQIPFDKGSTDLVCVYIVKEDRIVLIESEDILTFSEMTIK